MVGKELALSDSLSALEKLYVRIFGAPISGLRIRYRRLIPTVHKLMNMIRDSKEKDSTLSVLDVGCGTGIFTYEIAKQFPNAAVLGIDYTHELIAMNIEIAAKAGIHNCSFKNSDALDLNFKDQFDLAICIDILEDMEDDLSVIRNISRALKTNGFALLHVPGYYRRWFFFSKKTNFDVKGHFRPGYTLDEIRQKTVDGGFRILDIYYTYGWLETVTNNISYLITGAERKNKYIYALIFPILNVFAFFGQWARPKWGAGIAVLAQKEA